MFLARCQWLHNYLEYGQATDADRALCNLPPRNPDPTAPFESSLGRTLGLVQVSWPERGWMGGWVDGWMSSRRETQILRTALR